MNPRRLYRSRHDRQLAGIAGGMAEYLDLDPTLVRILWILSAFLGGFTVVLYIILAFVIPLEPSSQVPGTDQEPGAGSPPDGGSATLGWPAPGPEVRRHNRRGGRAGLYFGVLLIVFGAIVMADTLIPGWAGNWALGPALLVAMGGALVVGSIRHGVSEQ